MNCKEDSFYINKVLNGDLSSFAKLVEKHKSMAYTLAFRISKNHEDAEEIAQDAFMKAYQALNTFKQDSKFSTWLYKITYHTAISRFRKRQIESYVFDESIIDDEIGEVEINGLNALHQKQRKQIISDALGRLKEAEGVALTLFYLNENSVKEIGDITGYTSSNIKVLLHRGRKKLLLELKKVLKKEIVDLL